MSFTGREDHDISLNDAAKMTKNYRDRNPGEIKAHFFGKDTIQSILDQDECVGVRIYYAIDDNGSKHLVAVGTKADESDLYNGILAERTFPCPPYCGGGGNPLQ